MGSRRSALHVFGAGVSGSNRKFALELLDSQSGNRADGNDRSAPWIEKRSTEKLFHLGAHHLQRLGIDGIGFGENHNSTRNRQQPTDVEMLARLRFYAFIGRDHQQDDVDAANAGQHVAHKALVPGHIDESQPQLLAGLGCQFQVGKTEIDGNAPPLLFFQPVGIDAGKRLHQRGLAMIDMTGRANDYGFH